MARTLKQEVYDSHRNQILDAAQRLVYTKGYEQMSIQDLLGAVQISKGAFYHYFPSKQALMEGLIERMATQGVQVMAPIAADAHLSATQKLMGIFNQASRWKTARRDYLMALVKVWYADENAVLRLKSQAAVLPMVAPLITDIIRQGVEEGAFHTSHPEQACEIVFSMLQSFGDALVRQMLQPQADAQTLAYLEGLTASYQEAMERVLGARPGSLPLFDPSILREWFPLTENTDHQQGVTL